MAAFLQGLLYLIFLLLRWPSLPALERRSFWAKLSVLCLVALSAGGLLPLLLLEVTPLGDAPVRGRNQRGLTQRLSVLGIMAFMASYTWDRKGR